MYTEAGLRGDDLPWVVTSGSVKQRLRKEAERGSAPWCGDVYGGMVADLSSRCEFGFFEKQSSSSAQVCSQLRRRG